MALAQSHDLLVDADWSGADLAELARQHLKPFGDPGQVSITGPTVILQPNAVQHLGMAFHELGTNSAKYGALHRGGGTVLMTWKLGREGTDEAALDLSWEESFDPRVPEQTGKLRRGFGTVVLERVVPTALNGEAKLEHLARGLRWTLRAPLEGLRSGSPSLP